MAVGGSSGGSAGSIRAGRAHIEMSAKDAGLSRALSAIQARMMMIAKAAAAMGVALVAAIGVGVVTAFKSAVDHFDKMKKAADRLGTTTDKISGLGYAAEQSGASFEEMENAAKFLNKNLELNADAFKEFGLNAEHLKKMGLDEQMATIADAISAMPDASQRTAAALTLLGKAGDKLLPLFMSGGLRGLLQEAGDVGAIVDPEKAEQAERIGDAVSRAWTSVVNTFRTVGASFFGNVKSIEFGSRVMVLAMKSIRESIGEITFNIIGDRFSETWGGIKDAIKGNDLKLAWEIMILQLRISWKRGMAEMAIDFRNNFKEGLHEVALAWKLMGKGPGRLAAAENVLQGAGPLDVLGAMGGSGKLSGKGQGPMDLIKALMFGGTGSDEQNQIVTEHAAEQQKRFRQRDEQNAREKDALEKQLQGLQDQLNAKIRQAAVALTEGNPAFNLASYALQASLAASRQARPGNLSAESRGSFSTFAAQQALGIGTVQDKIAKNTGKTAEGVGELNKKIMDLRNEVL